MTSLRFLFAVLLAATLVGLPGASVAVDFVRGDSNGDGMITVADAAALIGYLFWGTEGPHCMLAGDFNDDGGLGLEDIAGIIGFSVGPGEAPPSPFPGPGPDPTPDDGLPCDAYGNQQPIDDPAARLRIEVDPAEGGEDVHATIRVLVSNSMPIWSLSGVVDIGEALVEDVDLIRKDGGLSSPGNHPDLLGCCGLWGRARVKDGKLSFGLLVPFGHPPLPPGEDVVHLEMKICLNGGTPAGEYPLTLTTGDLTRGLGPAENGEGNQDMGRKIVPALESTTLTVLEDVKEFSTCRVRPLEGVNVRFKLGDVTAAVGRSAAVPMFVNGDREGHGFGFEILFDTEILEATRIEQVFTRPDDLPFRDEFSEVDNENGAVRAFFKSSSRNERHFLPAFQDNAVIVLHFRVKGFADSTELRFNREYRLTTYKAFDDNFTPETGSSFVFVDSSIEIVPDISLFIRGDTNGDSLVNIADPIATLDFLFLSGETPYCLDGADANDDGSLDISDPIHTLNFLFVGSPRVLPPPTGAPGLDPTEDDLGCLR